MKMGRIIGLVVRVSALPFSFIACFAVGMFLASGWVAMILAGLFSLACSGAVFLWVIKNVRASVIGYLQEDTLRPRPKDHWTMIPMIMNTAADELALAARSYILFTLLAGYVLIAFISVFPPSQRSATVIFRPKALAGFWLVSR